MKKAVKLIHKTKNIDWKKFYWQNIKDIFIFFFFLISPLSCYATWSICVKSRLSEVRNSITVSWSRFKSKFPHAVICTVAKLTQSLKVKRKEMETVGVFFELQWKFQMNSWSPPPSNVHILWTGPGVSGNTLTFPEAGPLEGALERRGAQKAQQGEKTPHVYARISRQSPGPHTVTDCRSSGGHSVCAEPRSPPPSSSPTTTHAPAQCHRLPLRAGPVIVKSQLVSSSCRHVTQRKSSSVSN